MTILKVCLAMLPILSLFSCRSEIDREELERFERAHLGALLHNDELRENIDRMNSQYGNVFQIQNDLYAGILETTTLLKDNRNPSELGIFILNRAIERNSASGLKVAVDVLNHGIDPFSQNFELTTPIVLAVFEGNISVVEFIFSKYPDACDERDELGFCLLLYRSALTRDQKAISDYLEVLL